VVQTPVPAAASPDASARQLASEVFVLGFPLILMDAIRRAHPLAVSGFRLFPAASQALVPGLFHDDPDCLHTSAIVDLATGPTLLHLPNTYGRYISVTLIDSAGQAFASLGSHSDDHLAGDVMLAGPAWRGENRNGLRTLRTPCDSVWAVSRIVARNAPDHAAVESFAAEQGFSFPMGVNSGGHEAGAKSGLDVLDLTAIRQIAQMEPPALFHRLLHLVDRAPQPVQQRLGSAVRERLALLDRGGQSGPRADEILQRGFVDGWNAIQAARRAMVAEPLREWSAATPDAASSNAVDQAAAVLGALGAPLREDILTLRCNADESGRPLTGQEQYRLVMLAARLPPALSAWRLTAPPRDGQAPGDVIGDHSPLAASPDGSLELLVQRNPPVRRQHVNWLRAPDGPFELRLRLYAPTADTLSGNWRMAPVERLGSRGEGRLDRLARRLAAGPVRRLRVFSHVQWSASP
jgi:hypothetical protein